MKLIKKSILFLFLSYIFSVQAYAGFGWFLVGVAVGSSSKNKQKTLSELEYQIESINKKLPPNCGKLSIYSACWQRHNLKERIFEIPKNKNEEIYSHFKNAGYSVQLNNNQLIFNYSTSYEKYLEHQKVLISYEMLIILTIFGLIISYICHIFYKKMKRFQQIKSYYENDKSTIQFSESTDLIKFEDFLGKSKIPSNWNFNLDHSTKTIKSIGYYNGRSAGIIAWNKNALLSSLKNMVNKTK